MFNLRKDYNQTAQARAAEQISPSAVGLLEPKTIEINGYKFIISKMPCTVAQEVMFNLPIGLVPLLGNFTNAQEMVFKMLSYCERVYTDGQPSVKLISKEIIDNHIPDINTLLQLEQECIQYNFGFFNLERVLTFLQPALSRVESKISGILTDFLDKSLQAAEQAFGNSKQSTH